MLEIFRRIIRIIRGIWFIVSLIWFIASLVWDFYFFPNPYIIFIVLLVIVVVAIVVHLLGVDEIYAVLFVVIAIVANRLQERLPPLWKPSPEGYEIVKISVPGKYEYGKNYSCRKYYKKEVDFISNFAIDDEHLDSMSNVKLEIHGLSFEVLDCKEIEDVKFDFQLSCLDAKKIFSDKVLGCDGKNNALWSREVDKRILLAYARIIGDVVEEDVASSKSHNNKGYRLPADDK